MTELSAEKIFSMQEHSFRNFHAKGLDYLCLKRGPLLTVKAYFFEGDTRHLPEVVAPHDHRYDFRTHVLSGAVANTEFTPSAGGEQYEAFEYQTPLNGGDGFTWVGTKGLKVWGRKAYEKGMAYDMRAEQFHTIKILADRSVLLLFQYEDRLPVNVPTLTFRKGDKTPPSLSGLYERMSEDDVVRRVDQLESLVGRAEIRGLT